MANNIFISCEEADNGHNIPWYVGRIAPGQKKFLTGYSNSLPAHCRQTACPPTRKKNWPCQQGGSFRPRFAPTDPSQAARLLPVKQGAVSIVRTAPFSAIIFPAPDKSSGEIKQASLINPFDKYGLCQRPQQPSGRLRHISPRTCRQ